MTRATVVGVLVITHEYDCSAHPTETSPSAPLPQRHAIGAAEQTGESLGQVRERIRRGWSECARGGGIGGSTLTVAHAAAAPARRGRKPAAPGAERAGWAASRAYLSERTGLLAGANGPTGPARTDLLPGRGGPVGR
ncbi:wHTH domain-containing protein [Kribbella monticola]